MICGISDKLGGVRKYKYFQDPGHGWVQVPLDHLQQAGVGGDVSDYSFQKGRYVYLEEDCDAPMYLKALDAEGILYQLETVDIDDMQDTLATL